MWSRPKQCATGVLVGLWLAGAGLSVLARGGPQAASATTGTDASQSQDAFYRNMQLMHAQMLQLQATKDPATRAKLLEEHMRTMQATMPMMGGRAAPMRGAAGMGPGMMRGGMMGNGQMMRMMMEQMVQHQQAMQAMGCIR